MANRDDLLAEILADCQERKDRGEVVDRDALLAKHPELAEELGAYLSMSQRMDGAQDEPPSRIGDYEIREELGRGGMGIVYAALQTSIERPVAIKLLHTAFLRSPDAIARFRREARAAGQLRHKNIVPIRETGRERGIWYIAMELVDGEPLNRIVDGLAGRTKLTLTLPEGEEYFRFVADRFAGVADALQAAHDAGVIHRDIKPGNLILARDGPLMIVDFGLARLTTAGSMTATGSMLGTPEYMSPEQTLATGLQIDHRTDIYSLSATLYELLTLRPAFGGTSVAQICTAIATASPRAPRKIDPRIPWSLENIVLHGMAKDPAQRYQTAADMAEDLRRFAKGERTAAKRPRPRWLLPAAIVLIAAAATAIAWPTDEPAPVQQFAGSDEFERATRLEAEGRLDDALAAIDKALRSSANPKRIALRLRLLMELGRDQELYEAARGYREGGKLRMALVTRCEIAALRALNRTADAKKIAQAHIDSGRKGRGVPMHYLLAVTGREAEARRGLARIKDGYYAACVASVLGDRDATIAALGRAAEDGQTIPPNALPDPDLRIWNDDAGVQAALESMRGRGAVAKSPRAKGSRRKALALEAAGQLDEALVEIDAACTPKSLGANTARVRILMELGRYDLMLQRCREAQKTGRKKPGMMRNEVVALRALGRHGEARTVAKAIQEAGLGMPYSRAYAAATLGQESEARAALASARRMPFENAWVYSILKDRDGTIRSLQAAIARDQRIPPNAKTPPDLDVWKDDDKIQGLLAQMRAN